MKFDLKKFWAPVAAFLARQYFVLFFMIATGLKLCYFSHLIGINNPFSNMWSGYVLSFFTAILIFTPILFVKKFKKPVSIVIAVFIALVMWADLVYFRFFQTLPTFGLLDTFGQSGDVLPSITNLMKWVDIILFADIILVTVFEILAKFVFNLKFIRAHKELNINVAEKIFLGLVLFLIAFLIFAFSTMEKPRAKLSDAFAWSFEARYNTQYFGLIAAHFIDAYRFIEESNREISVEEKKMVIDWTQSHKLSQGENKFTGTAKGKRVIIIQVESLGSFVIGKKVDGQEITPNLNKLAAGSHYYEDTRFIMGSGHTSDTDLAINTSLVPLYDSAAFVRHGKDNFTALAQLLSQKGYSTLAYHAYNRNFWNRSVAFRSLGYQKFYAAESYTKGDIVNMNGLKDDQFMKETFEYIKKQPKKSLNYVITLSSHYPFEITKDTKGLKINENDYPAFVGGYLQNINYTDKALGDFIEKLKNSGMYDDSLLIVYGDHSPTMNKFSAGDLSFDPAGVDAKRVPLFIKQPGQTVAEKHDGMVSTLDIMPTILDLLGVKTKAMLFGQSLFVADGEKRARCNDGSVILEQDNSDCKIIIENSKKMSAKIIKFNLFDDILK